MNNNKVKDLVESGLAVALICVGILFFRIPSITGYSHLGDSIIFISVLMLGKNRGALASGMGGALSDLLCGYANWSIPTFIIKYIMAYIMGYIIEHQTQKTKFSWISGAVLGSIWQIFAYPFAHLIMFNMNTAIASIPGIIIQSATGALIAIVIIFAVNKSPIAKKVFNKI